MAYTSFENEEKKEIVDASERGEARINSAALAFCILVSVLPRFFLSTFSFLDDVF